MLSNANAMDQVNVGSTKEGNKLISGRHRTPIFIIRNDPSAWARSCDLCQLAASLISPPSILFFIDDPHIKFSQLIFKIQEYEGHSRTGRGALKMQI